MAFFQEGQPGEDRGRAESDANLLEDDSTQSEIIKVG
jgi:hypothetical protein